MQVAIKERKTIYDTPNYHITLRIPANACDVEKLRINNWKPTVNGDTVIVKNVVRNGRANADAFVQMIEKYFTYQA